MASFYARYQNGCHQEVYDELMEMGERVFEPPFYNEVLLVAKEMMRRVRHNLDLLIPLNYHVELLMLRSS